MSSKSLMNQDGDTAVKTGSIATYSGRVFTPLAPVVDDIAIEDIAHALSQNCRFTGHTREFYSVAQHSVLVSEIVPGELALTGLLHDASEAYLSDIARPIKQQQEFGAAYREVESRLEDAIARRFDLVYPYPQAIKDADMILLRSEQRDLMPDLLRHDDGEYLDDTIYPWTPDQAEEIFLDYFWNLYTEA